MDESTYTLAGWLAIGAAVLALPLMVLGFMVDVATRRGADLLPVFLLLFASVTVIHTAMQVYAFSRLRHLLNERFGFHAVDTLIIAIIATTIALVSVSILSRVGLAAGVVGEELTPVFLGIIVLFSLPLAVMGIIFAVKLLSLQDDLHGLLRPYAYTSIAAAICFATIILAPIGMIVAAVSTAILGTIFLKADHTPQVDFV
jgi:hypothetical protein